MVVGNWKMNLTKVEAISLVRSILANLQNKNTEVVFSPNFLYLQEIQEICSAYENVKVAAQNCHHSNKGAFTGEVSAIMLASCQVNYVIIGHSERREYFRETNAVLSEKVNRALENQLKIIFCLGENLQQREQNIHFEWIEQQLEEGLFHLKSEDFKKNVVAYEPIWAIGTGKTATKDQAQEMHAFIRSVIAKKYGKEIAEDTLLLYGGSCNSSNAKELFSQQDIDGGLIGGASLKSEEFLSIIHA